MIRFFDVVFSILGLLFFSPLFILVYIISYIDTGSPIFRQKRMGKEMISFNLMKFRTMYVSAPEVATHLSQSSLITPIGFILRNTKLDELPQLFNVLKGEMSLVGPRPNLLNQPELIFERESRGIYAWPPGITGISQICKVDMSNPKRLARFDKILIRKITLRVYFYCLFKTLIGNGFGDRIVK